MEVLEDDKADKMVAQTFFTQMNLQYFSFLYNYLLMNFIINFCSQPSNKLQH